MNAENQPYRVDVFADPGLPTRVVRDVLAGTDNGRTEGPYDLSYNSRQIPLRDDGTLDLEAVRQWSRRNESDLLVVVTEIPRRAGSRPKISALHFAERLAVISLPALGPFAVRKKLQRVVFDSLDALVEQEVPDLSTTRMRFGSVHEQDSDSGRSIYVDSPWWRPRRTALVLGMVRTNEPLAAVAKLSGVLAAASATGAFGIFYSSIWEMAEALPFWRMALITLSAITAMVLWLLISNRLWERSGQVGSLTEAAMYNLSTLATLALSVTVLYLALVLGIFAAAFIVIEPGFMSDTIGAQASLTNYLDIAWLAASMGTVAGALGSNFDSREDVAGLTQGRREAQRYRQREEARANE